MASDFQCPYCKAWHDATFASLVKNYVATHKVRMAFLNMPLSIHPNAQPAAEAAMCAAAQGKFWPMHDSLFASQPRWETLQEPRLIFQALSQELGLDIPAWQSCMTQHVMLPMIVADRDRMRERGVNSTPTFFVGAEKLAGADAKIKEALDAALAAQGAKKPGN
jgi:protein-disulfide isomerase